jgi:hypothetical protein
MPIFAPVGNGLAARSLKPYLTIQSIPVSWWRAMNANLKNQETAGRLTGSVTACHRDEPSPDSLPVTCRPCGSLN